MSPFFTLVLFVSHCGMDRPGIAAKPFPLGDSMLKLLDMMIAGTIYKVRKEKRKSRKFSLRQREEGEGKR